MEDPLKNEILAYVKRKGEATSPEIAEEFGLNKKKASKIMSALNQKWMLLKIARFDGRSRKYRLSD